MKSHFLGILLASTALGLCYNAPSRAAAAADDDLSVNESDLGAPVDYGFGPGKGIPKSARRMANASAGVQPLISGHLPGAVSQGGPTAGTTGFFDPPVTTPLNGLHQLLLPDGRVMNYGTNPNGTQGAYMYYDVWDPSMGTGADAHSLLINTTATDIFCSFQSMIWTTGEDLITGGDLTVNGKRNSSNPQVTIFSPATNTIRNQGQMTYARWYPTIVAMPNNDMVTIGGRQGLAVPTTTPEIYNPATGWRLLTGATSTAAFGNQSRDWFYPKSFVAPSGNIFDIEPDGKMWIMSTTANSGAGSITAAGTTDLGSWNLPTLMYAPGKILSLRANSVVDTIDITTDTPVSTHTAPIDQVRFWASGVVMPDGKVLVTGGSSVTNKDTDVAYTSQIWNPITGLWTTGASYTKPRLYHSISLLMPDATVLVGAGGTPGPQLEENTEIYYPPYLYLNDGSGTPAPRPTLVSAPQSVSLGQTVTATVGNTDVISRVTMVRTGSVTHCTNPDQRFLQMNFTQTGNTLSVQLPNMPNVMVPGYYMMFAFQNGVPSVSKIMLVTSDGIGVAPQAAGRQAVASATRGK